MKKFEFEPPDPNYFVKLKLRPKLGFYRLLCEIEYPLEKLNLQIPETILSYRIRGSNGCLIYYGINFQMKSIDEEKNVLAKRLANGAEQFAKLLYNIELANYSRNIEDDEDPICITKYPSKEYFRGDKVIFCKSI